MRRLRQLLGLCLLPLLAACSSEPAETPEQRIRAFIEQGEAAAEARDLDFFAGMISHDYSDDHMRSRRDMVRIATGYFLRNKSIHLLLRVEEVQLLADDQAKAVLHAGIAGSPVDGFQQLFATRASVYRMELTFRMADEIKLLHAQWRRVDAKEVLPEL